MAVPTLYVALISAAISAGAAGWFGYDYGQLTGYGDGFEKGVRSQQGISDKETARLLAQNRAESEITLRLANEKAREREQIDQQKLDAAELKYVEATKNMSADIDALRERVRIATKAAARNPIRVPDGNSRMPEAAAQVDSVDGTFAEWLVSETGGGSILRLAKTGDELNEQFILCRASGP